MKKKILSLCLVVAMVATAIAGASMAYLTDTEEAVNVMTVGNVDIVQNEHNQDGTTFTQGQTLLPIVTPYNIKGEDGYPQCENYIDKLVSVSNVGKSDAYVRTFIAIPALSYEGYEENNASVNVLHWNGFGAEQTKDTANQVYIDGVLTEVDNDWYWGKSADAGYWPGNGGDWNSFTTTINNQEYSVYVITHKSAVEAGATTAHNLSGFYLDSKVDFDGVNYTYDGKVISGLDDTFEILVATQAVQAGGWDDAWTALNTAFYTPDKDNHPWVDGVDIPTLVATADELATALAAGEDVMLTEDVDAGGQVFVLNGGVLDGNGNTLTVDSGDAAYESGLTVAEGTAKNVTVTGAYRGLGVGGSGASEMTGDVVYENVTVTGATYGINIGIGNDHKLTMINCTLGDWNSYSGLSGAEFIGCTFTSAGNYYASQRVSANATFTYTNCEFKQNTYDNTGGSNNYYLDSYGGGTIVLDNCTMDGEKITVDNVDELFQIETKRNVTVTVK